MGARSLQIQQLEGKMHAFTEPDKIAVPPTGWIRAIRLALGISAQQLGNKLSMTRQGVYDMEVREQEGSISINALKETAKALNMHLVYGFVPDDGSLEALIEKKAGEMAKQIVLRTANSMALEDQANSAARIEKAIAERKEAITREIPKALWD